MSATYRRARESKIDEGLAPRALPELRPLLVDNGTLYASIGLDLYASSDDGETLRRIGAAPSGPAGRLLLRNAWASRLLRAGFHHLVRRLDGSFVAVVRGAILFKGRDEVRFRVAHAVERGTRPLSVVQSWTGRLYFGEYFRNARRDSVHVFGSEDGESWEVVHTFPAGSIRHVHGIVRDDLRGGLWVLTGDEGDEAGLWWTDDEFRTLTPVMRGDQRVRAVSILPVEEGLIVPMDAPGETNAIHMIDPETRSAARLAELPGSAFHATRVDELFLVSTGVETSPGNTDSRASLFASVDGWTWSPVARIARDLPRLDDKRGYLQYPTIGLVPTHGASESVFARATSLSSLHGAALRWRTRDVVEAVLEHEDAWRERAS